MKEILNLYKIHGSFGNNTTIPLEEKHRICAMEPDFTENSEGRMKWRGEEALHYLYSEFNLVPKGTWIDYEGINYKEMEEKKKNLPLCKQRDYRGRLPKSERNFDNFMKKREK